MGGTSKIQWTDASWTPIRARVRSDAGVIAGDKGYLSLAPRAARMLGHVGPHCEHVSPGCEHCYSEWNNLRGLPSNGTGLPFDRRSRDLVEVFADEKILEWPLHWKRPRQVFVCSQTDLFGEFVPSALIYYVFAVMSQCPQHTFQVLTKRHERMREILSNPSIEDFIDEAGCDFGWCHANVMGPWPLPNVWLGVSVEDQQRADERIPMLLQTPAALRFVSAEPLLERIDLTQCGATGMEFCGKGINCERQVDWIICGGESGPHARPFKIEWATDLIGQCREAGVACFMKQVGSNSDLVDWMEVRQKDRKGGDPAEWPEGIKVRAIPRTA